MKKNDLVFSPMHLKNFSIIEEPGNYKVRCLSKLDFDDGLYLDDGYPRWVVNLGCLTAQQATIVEDTYKLNTLNGICTYYKDISAFLGSGSIWENQVFKAKELPLKGELISAVYEYKNNRLLCTSLNIIPRDVPKLYKPAALLLEELKFLEDL